MQNYFLLDEMFAHSVLRFFLLCRIEHCDNFINLIVVIEANYSLQLNRKV